MPAVMNYVKTGLRQEATKTEDTIAKNQAHLVQVENELANVKLLDAEQMMFSAYIYDPYDAMGDMQLSCKATERGLQRTIEAVEREYSSRAGSLRKDKALRYTVSAHLASTDIDLPPAVWLPYSQQTQTTISSKRF